MSSLDTSARLVDPDAAYNAVVDAHRGLSDEQSAALNARLILILVNHIADPGGLVSSEEIRHRPVGVPSTTAGIERTSSGWLPGERPIVVGLTAGASTPTKS